MFICGVGGFEFEFEWGFYTLSASKAIFRARTYNCITYSVLSCIQVASPNRGRRLR